MEITFEFACQDDCLDKMVPSDLRQVVAARDRYKALLEECHTQLHRTHAAIIEFYRWKYGDDALSVSEIIRDVMSHAPNVNYQTAGALPVREA
jgi:hypothetical protein